MFISNSIIHIGQMIRAELRAQGRTVRWFAESIHRDYSDVFKMFKRATIDLSLLIHISKVLNHDFLRDISDILNQDSASTTTPKLSDC